MPKTNGYISLMDASKFCNYSQEYLSLRARQGKLKAVKFGRNWVTKKEWLEEYLNKNSRPLEVIKTKSKVQGFRYALRYSLVVVLIFFFLSFLVPATLIINKDIWRTVSGVFVTNQEQVLRTSSHIGNSIHQISFLTESQDILKADINIFQQFADWYHGQTVLLGQKIVALYDSVKSFFSPIETVIVEKEVINEETLREIEKLQLRIEEMEKQGLSQQEIIEEIQKITQTESLKEVIKEIQVVDYQSLAQLKDLLNRMTQAETDIEALIVLSQQPRSRSSYISSSQDLRNLNIVGSTVLGDETSDTLTVNATSIFNGPASFSEIDSDLIPSVTNTYNLGSATNYWNSAYINNITVGSTNMAGTTSESFVLNTDNTTADAEDMWLEFERGTATPNAKILWSNSLTGNSWFDLNFPIYLSGTGQISGPGATGLTLTNDIGDLTISTTTSGNLNLTSAGNITETIASAGTYTLTDATTNFLAVDTNGAIALTPTAGQDLSVNLSTTGDFVVNTNDFFIDTSENKIGIGTNAPSEKLHLQDGTLLIDQPVNPTLIGAYNTNDYAEGVYVSGKYAYVADSAGLYIIDVSNPSSPSLTSSYASGSGRGVYVSGKYAYVADGLAGLKIIDISNSSSPSLTGTYNTSGTARGVYVSGKYAYVADGLDGLQIIDISNPSSPSLTGTYNTSGGAIGVYVSGKYAYVVDGLAGLQIIDISNSSSPSLTGTYNTSDYAEGVYVSGKYAYVADAESGLQIIDISNPSSPSLTGTYNTSDYAYGVYVSGKYAYVADGFAGLQIIDISNPSSPSLTGTYNTSGYTEGVYVSGKYAYLADGYSGLKIIDVSNPSSPNLVGGHNLSDDYQWDVFVSGKYAYLADRNYGLHIVDIKGADIHALAAGNVSTNDLTVWENADIGNNLYVRSGLNVGPQGIYSQGPIAGSFSVSPSGNITMADDTWIGLASDGGRIVFDSTPAEDTITVNSAHLLFSADNTYDIGASGATRPRTGYFGTSVVVADTTTLTTDALIGSGALTVQSTGADLTLTNTTSGNIAITSLGNITETIASAGTYTLTDATTNFLAVNSSGAIAITPTAGQDLSVNLTTTGDFAVNTNDFFIDTSEGKIGIGTAVPSAGLEVASIEGIDLKIGDDLSGLPYNSTDTYFTIGQSDSSSNIYIGQDGSNYGAFSWFYNSTPANAYLKISTNNNQNIMMSPGTANVGIGVADPDTRLEVYYAGTQMKLSYDGTDNATFAVDDNGDLIINTSGGDISLGDENLTTTGTITGNFSVSPSGNIVMADDTWIGLASDGGRIVFDSTPDPDTLTINAADLLFNADNTYDIGASGASRPRTGYFGTSVVVGDTTALDANSLTGSGTLTVQSTGADLTLTNVTSGNIAITSLGNLTETIATGSTYTLKDGSTNFLAIDASGAMAMTPTSGQDLSVNLATTGDFVVNTNDFFIDTSEGKIGIGTTTPKYKFDVTGQGRFFSLSTTPLTLIQAETTGKLAEFKAHLPGAVNLSLGTSLNELTTTLIPKSALEFRFKSSVAWTAKSAWNTPDVGGKTRPAFADLDNDGDYDLLIGASSGLSYAYENTGSPTSPAWTEKSAWNTPDIGEGSDPAFADLDNDGDYDLLIGASSGLSYAYENTGSPTSPAWTEKSAWNAPDIGTYSGPAFADLDNDGDYDLLIGELNGISYAYENTGSASSPAWTAKSSWNAPDIGNYSTPAFADLDNDGDYDLLIGAITGISYAYENTGSASSPTWTAKSAWNAPKVGNSDSDPAFADLDNDGDYDLLIGEWNGISYAYENTGSNTSIFFGKLGNVGIGLAAPGRHLDVLDATAATPQLRLTSDADTYGEFYIDATGDLSIGLTDGSGGDDIIILDENLKICSGGSFGSVSCPSITLTGTGNLVVEGDVYAAGGYKNSFSFMYSDVADSQTDLVIDVLGLAGNTEYILPYSGSIIGVSATSNADLTAGTVTVDPAINGTKTGLTTTLSDTYQYNSATQDVNTDTFSAGDRLTIKVTTDADVEPNTIDIVVTIVIEY